MELILFVLSLVLLISWFVGIARLGQIRNEARSTNLWLERLDWHLSQMHKEEEPEDLPEPPPAGRGEWPG